MKEDTRIVRKRPAQEPCDMLTPGLVSEDWPLPGPPPGLARSPVLLAALHSTPAPASMSVCLLCALCTHMCMLAVTRDRVLHAWPVPLCTHVLIHHATCTYMLHMVCAICTWTHILVCHVCMCVTRVHIYCATCTHAYVVTTLYIPLYYIRCMCSRRNGLFYELVIFAKSCITKS